jgi:hypothetical protein
MAKWTYLSFDRGVGRGGGKMKRGGRKKRK